MKIIRQAIIRNSQKYFFNDMTNIKNIDPSLLNLDQLSFENNDSVIYEIDYLKNFNNKNSLYLVFDNVDAYIEYNPAEDDSESKYLVFAFKDKNREALGNYTGL